MDAHARGRRSVEVPRLGVDLREEVGDGASHDRLVNRRAVRDAHREAVRMGAGEPGEVVRARLCGAVADKPIVPVDGQAPGGHANHADGWWVAPAGSWQMRATVAALGAVSACVVQPGEMCGRYPVSYT